MKSYQVSQLGVIFFFLGLTLLLFSWHISYPINIGSLDELTFSQFSLLIWPGILFSLMGLFITGYFSKRNSVKAICASLFPICLYAYVLFFSGTSTSDIGNVKSMYAVFQITGIDSSVVSYFQYPVYFTLNDVFGKITGMDVNGIAMIFFILYGFLLGLYLYLFLFRVTENNRYQIALLGVFIYFTVSFSYLNYQWVPQTLALVFFFLILVTFNLEGTRYKILTLVFFIALIFTHAFIPVLFLLFFGLYSIKKREYAKMFVLMLCLYIAVLVYFTTYYFPQIIAAFSETVNGFNGLGQYSSTLSQSFKETTTNSFDQAISLINRVRVPITLLIVSVGFLIGVIKKKIDYILIILAVVGGLYLVLGLAYPVLGLRALQILIAALVVGIGFFISKMKRPTAILVLVLIIFSVFGSIRGSYEQTQFITNEEENTCHFLVSSISYVNPTTKAVMWNYIGVDQVEWGYVNNTKPFVTDTHDTGIVRATSKIFYNIFFNISRKNNSFRNNSFLVYNSNLGKEIRDNGFITNYKENISKAIIFNNKIYSCGNTYILT